MDERRHVFLSGSVQGVGLRWRAKEHASALGLVGVARNLLDGRVEIILEGSTEALQKFIEWCYSGAQHARIDAVDVREEPKEGTFRHFSIE